MAEPVGLQVQTPDVFGKLSQLLSIRRQRAEIQQTEQTTRQRAALANYDWNKHIGDDGTFDLNTLSDPELQHAAGDQYLDVVQKAVTAKASQLEAKSRLVGLRNDQRKAFSDMMGALRSDADIAEDNEKGRQKVNQAMVQYGQMYGEDVLPVLEAYAAPLQRAPKGRMNDALKAIQLQALDASNQVETQKPQYTSTGARLKQVNPLAPKAGPIQSEIPLEVGPGAQIVTDAYGRMFRVNPQTNQAVPVGASPNASPGASIGGPAFPYPGQQHDIANQQTEVQNVRAAADQAPANRNIFQHILKLSSQTSTGPLISFLQNTSIGGQAFGDNYQELGKYLEKNAIANMQAMGGPPSDARLSAAVAANGSTKFNPQALRAVTQFNYATNTGLERYRQGLDEAVGTKSPDYSKLPQFKSEWAKNFDIDAFRLENAIADGDERAKNEILNNLTDKQAALLIKKMKNLDSLAEKGHLPNE